MHLLVLLILDGRYASTGKNRIGGVQYIQRPATGARPLRLDVESSGL